MRKSNDELIDVDVKIHRVSQSAIRVSTNGEIDDAVWLPKSQCVLPEEAGFDWEGTIQVKQWLAEREGLI